ncbi:MAG: TlpA family protein disulfide reductase, partial [Gammaproteobacteria bacterium]
LMSTPVFSIEVGDAAPTFTLPRLSDDSGVALAQFADKVVYLDFWASWCAPCRTSFPLLNRLYRKYNARGLEVVAVNLDEERGAAEKFLSDIPVSFNVLRDADGQWAETYAVASMPTSYIIDRQGVVRRVHNGFAKSDIEELENQIVSLLGKK